MITAICDINSIVADSSINLSNELWTEKLIELSDRDDRNPKLSGYAAGILLEENEISDEKLSIEISRRLSPGVDVDLGAGWFEGLASRNHYTLVSKLIILQKLDEYIGFLDDEEFRRALVFLSTLEEISEECANDPVDMIFGIQLGGGTNINKSVTYCEKFITEPKKTIFILIYDLYEGGNEADLIRRVKDMKEAGVTVICLLAISDNGVPDYDEGLARKFASFNIPTFGSAPNVLPQLVEAALKNKDLE